MRCLSGMFYKFRDVSLYRCYIAPSRLREICCAVFVIYVFSGSNTRTRWRSWRWSSTQTLSNMVRSYSTFATLRFAIVVVPVKPGIAWACFYRKHFSESVCGALNWKNGRPLVIWRYCCSLRELVFRSDSCSVRVLWFCLLSSRCHHPSFLFVMHV